MKNPISDAAKMILSNLNHLHSKIVREQDLTLGKTVSLFMKEVTKYICFPYF